MIDQDVEWWIVVHRVFNAAEALFWLAAGAGFLVRAGRRSSSLPGGLLVLAGVTCIVFAGSDVVEIRTGTWFRPWWLLAWNAACVAALLGSRVWYRRVKRG